ncbi:MAG: acyl-CoA thioesterase [Balneolaceae bacterium]
MNKILQSTIKIRFQDCDPFNHLNNAKYIDYFINAREDQLAEYYDIDVYDNAFKEGLVWVVASNQISYLNPANTMETVIIESQLIKFSSKKLIVEMRMWDKNKIQLKSVVWISFVHFNLNKKKTSSHSSDFIALFEKVVLPVEQTTFEARIRQLTVKYGRAS